MKIGIFGGTFDPVHTGHLIVAEVVREKIGLDRIVFIPAAIPPHKQQSDILDVYHRLEMLHLAAAGNPGFEISDIEAERGGVSYTVDTLTELPKTFSRDELVLLIGQDNVAEFGTWKDPGRILELARVVVMTRPGFALERRLAAAEPMALCEVPEIGIASREIRERVRNRLSIRYLVPETVAEYIEQHGLYRDANPL